ncbi:hypothetical protein SADUNF_Sadunf12G0045800 [Salix dunnii]|uniref:Uncharacterized protein n=1 Tax=Salix dunnii TaxID=1413687 RepID=A0A835MMV8_9ROSI|nr:hypothetical protein SADUNF_Sadunf12G0045800 [Salix dunnii]
MSPLLFLLAFLWPLIHVLRAILSRLIDDRKLPPGPPCLPIIGNLHLLGSLPHRALHQLAKKHGHIMSLRLGYVPTIVVSSPQAAELFLKTHDAIFASRPKSQASLYMSYGAKGIAFTEYGPYWRNVKKLCISHVLSSSKIEYFEPLRREEVGLFIDSIKKAAAAHEAVDISKMAGNVIQSMACRMLFGENKDDEIDMKSLVKEAVLLAGAFNIADYVPFFGAFDLQGLTKRMKAFSKSMDKVLEKIIDEHEQDVPRQKNQPNDFVDVLLSLLNDRNESLDEKTFVIDRTNIKAIIIDMIVGTVDTSSTTVEWTLSELLRHPHIMKRVQKELDGVVGMHRMVNEKDLSSLTYLDMLLHCFDLEPPNGMLPLELDMNEIFGLATQRVTPLIVVPTYRLRS